MNRSRLTLPAASHIARSAHRPKNATSMALHARNGTADAKKPTNGVNGRGADRRTGRGVGRLQAKAERPAPGGTGVSRATARKTKAKGKDLYDEALRLARLAEKTDGPWPVTILREAAATGYAPAQYALATWYLFGRGVKRDYKKAFSLLLQSAEQNYALAEFDIAVSFEKGKGTDKSEKSAFRYYRRAAEHDDLSGMTEVARCYWFGIGTVKDCRKAANWYMKAARRGDSESQATIATLFESGEGVRRNMDKAIYWHEKAAAQHEPEAMRVLKELSSKASS